MKPMAEQAAALSEARTTEEFAAARVLIEEYAAQLRIDLCFQGFAAELERLSQIYSPPSGCLLLARRPESGDYLGCGAVRRLSDADCEMKRLYLKPAARGEGLGRRIAEALADRARSLEYRRMFLDTLAEMTAARTLYRSMGFRETAPYYENPSADVVYLELDLGASRPPTR